MTLQGLEHAVRAQQRAGSFSIVGEWVALGVGGSVLGALVGAILSVTMLPLIVFAHRVEQASLIGDAGLILIANVGIPFLVAPFVGMVAGLVGGLIGLRLAGARRLEGQELGRGDVGAVALGIFLGVLAELGPLAQALSR